MHADLTDQLRAYFTAIDDDQGRPELAAIATARHPRVELIEPTAVDAHRTSAPNRHGWMIAAAVLIIAAGSLVVVLRRANETPTAAGLLDGAIVFEGQDRSANRLTDIYVMDLATAETVRLTDHPGPDRNPSWSPDGTRIVFDANRAALGEDNGIYVMNADGTDQTRIGTGWAPRWSPDGDRILYLSSDGITTMNPDGTDSTPITDGESPAWSADGTQIVFSRRTRSDEPILNAELFIIDRDGSNETQLTDTPSEDEDFPSWSPDGTRIAYRTDYSSRELGLIDADGTNSRRLPIDNEAFPFLPAAWSTDGRLLAYVNLTVDDSELSPTGITIVDPDTNQTVATLQTTPRDVTGLSWR